MSVKKKKVSHMKTGNAEVKAALSRQAD